MVTATINAIKVEIVNPLSPSLLCPICREVFSEPLINKRCHHSFCAECIRKSIEASPTCPLCRLQLEPSDLHPNLALSSLVNEIPVYCINRALGCSMNVAFELYHNHIENCSYSQKECPHVSLGCTFRCYGHELARHLDQCPFQAILPFINSTTARLLKLEDIVLSQAKELEALKGAISDTSRDAPIHPEVCSRNDTSLNSPQEDEIFPYNQIQVQQTLTCHNSGVTSLAYSNNLLFSGAHDGIAQIHDTTSMTMLWSRPIHSTSVWGLAVAQDEKRFFSASSDGMIKAWDWTSENESGFEGHAHTLDHRSGKVYSLMFRFGKLFSGSSDRTIKIWDPRALGLCQTLSGHQGSVNCISALRNTRLVSGSSDRLIKLWDLSTSRCISTLSASDSEVLDVVASEDQKLLFASTYDASILVFNLENNSLIATLQGHHWEVWKLALCQTRLFSASFDHSIKRWDTRMLRCDATLTGHKGFVHALQLTPEGMFSACADRTIKYWK